MISKEEVNRIAKLARLNLTKKEKDKLQKDLSEILDYFNKLKEVNIEGIKPANHSVLIKNILREDEVKKTDDKVKEKSMEQAPEKKDNYLKVKSVL